MKTTCDIIRKRIEEIQDLLDDNPGNKRYEWLISELEFMFGKIQPIEESNGWISVEDRLPIEHGYYIVFHNGDVFVGFYDKCEKEWSCDFEDFKPTHWQPLPDTPKVFPEPPLSIGDNSK